MNYKSDYNLLLKARNEGKIKSYESCDDIRAWSHDIGAQDQYLREWMKCDMPLCVLPVSILARFLRTMTCGSRRRVAPKCHPDCKSKILLETIYNSCYAVRNCLKQNNNFEKYFVEEELETSHWPCDRCLDALKIIKMLWKIIIDKLFRINMSKLEKLEHPTSSCDSVNCIAKAWQRDMIQQALFINSLAPCLDKAKLARTSILSSNKAIKSCPNCQHADEKSSNTKPKDCKMTKTIYCNNKFHKCTSVAIPVAEVGCDTCFLEKENDELDLYKRNLEVLQDRCNIQNMEIDRLQEENTSLKLELENVYKSGDWKASFYNRSQCLDSCNIFNHLPTPFETCIDEKCPNSAENIDSEMVITMRNCKNDFFKHVSLLQVLHKTNSPIKDDLSCPNHCAEKDPLRILTKVQNTFGAIVKREMSIVNDKKQRSKRNNVEASFRKIRPCRSNPSCSTLSSRFSAEFVPSNNIACNEVAM